MKIVFGLYCTLFTTFLCAQINTPSWLEITETLDDSNRYVQLYSSTSDLKFQDGRTEKFRGYYASFDMNNKNIRFEINYTKLPENHVEKFMDDKKTILIVNGGFFGIAGSLSLVINKNELLSKNPSILIRNGTKHCVSRPAFYLNKENAPKISWIYTLDDKTYSLQDPLSSQNCSNIEKLVLSENVMKVDPTFAIGGGPMLINKGKLISNYEKELFMDDIIHSKAPRTAIGITSDQKIIILVSEGRLPEFKGVSLITLSKILKDIGCVTAMNLDGGGSSFMYAFGKQLNRIPSVKVRDITSSISISTK